MRRGSRWVPPAAGISPKRVSVRPRRTVGASAAIRESHASANSSPPPSAGPFIAATVVNGSAARSFRTCCIARLACSASACDAPRKSERSAPAMNWPSFPLATTRPRGFASRAWAIAAARSSRSFTSIALTGSSGRSMTIRATPEASAGTKVTDRRGAVGSTTGASGGWGAEAPEILVITTRAPRGSRRRSRLPRTRSRGRTSRRAGASRSPA